MRVRAAGICGSDLHPYRKGQGESPVAGKVKDKQVVSHTFPLDRINEAFETAINMQDSIKVMIEP